MKITVIGAGNGGVTAAYHFLKLGHDVCLYDQETFSTHLKAIDKNGGINALDTLNDVPLILSGFQSINKVTTDIGEALNYSSILIMVVPTFAQEVLFELMLPHLNSEHILLSMPGNYGSLVMNRMKNDMGYKNLNLAFVDAISIPWACRLGEPGNVGIMGIKEFIYVGVYPKGKTNKILKKLNNFFPIEIKALTNVIEAGLENINFGGHPLITTLNIGLLENFKGKFNYYNDCVSPSTDKASAKMETERLEVGKALGFNLIPELEMMNALYNSNYASVYDFNKNSVTHGKIHSAPDSSKTRYITEDVPNILVPIYEFAKLSHTDTPIIESCIRIASAYNDIDYFQHGRTIAKMGLANLSLEEIIDLVNS